MMKNYFITGTDTGVGKTYATIQLAKHFIKLGHRVAALKPIASGASSVNGELHNEDADQYLQINNVALTYPQINPYCFVPPISPHFAAARQGIHIDFEVINSQINYAKTLADIVLVESAGGWYTPLSNDLTIASLAQSLKLPVILVVGLRLGCINHAALTASAIQQSGCEFSGWIANVIDPFYALVDESILTIQRTISVPLLGKLLHATSTTDSFTID